MPQSAQPSPHLYITRRGSPRPFTKATEDVNVSSNEIEADSYCSFTRASGRSLTHARKVYRFVLLPKKVKVAIVIDSIRALHFNYIAIARDPLSSLRRT